MLSCVSYQVSSKNLYRSSYLIFSIMKNIILLALLIGYELNPNVEGVDLQLCESENTCIGESKDIFNLRIADDLSVQSVKEVERDLVSVV